MATKAEKEAAEKKLAEEAAAGAAAAKAALAQDPAVKAAEEAALAAQDGGNIGEAAPAPASVADAIFGATPEVKKDPVIGTPAAKVTPTEKSIGQEKGKTVTISLDQFESIMGRLNDLESVSLNSSRTKEDVFNPLQEVKTDHVVRLTYHGDLLVVGYKAKIKPDGTKRYTWLEKNEASGEVRTRITLYLMDMDTSDVTEQTVDYVDFIEQSVTVDATLKERKDIGKVVEQGLVNQMVWNGKTLTDTGIKIMSGHKEQIFVFKVEHKGKILELAQEVINIK